MSYLQGRVIHVDKHLSNIALNYRPTGFIADMLFPIVPVQFQSDMIKTYNQADLFRIENTIRAPGTEANKIAFQVGSENYYCKNYALKVSTTIEERANADPIFIRDTENGKVMFLQDALKLDWENRAAATAVNTSNVGTNFTVASAWTDYTNARPLEDLWTAMDQQADLTGYRPNQVTFSENAWRNFARNAQVIDKVNGTGVSGGGKNATKEQAATLLEVDRVLVGGAYKNTADEGQAMALSQIWNAVVLLNYVPARPSLDLPSHGYSFRWRKPGLMNMNVARHPYDSKIQADEIESGYYQDEKVIAKNLGSIVQAVNG